jgi:DNA processing protein
VGNVLYRNLLSAFGEPEAVFSAGREALAPVEGMSKKALQGILRFKGDPWIGEELIKVEKMEMEILPLTDSRYPHLLKEIPDPPPYLYFKGTWQPGDSPAMALVGSRLCSYYGESMTLRLASALARRGLAVVSGMARGIDTLAHQGALKAGGKTVAVLGSGLDWIYPKENETLYRQILEQGGVISEFPLGTAPEAKNFPVRNRIISGMSLGVVVVEATERSGSLITARLAMEQGREVFAVPGPVDAAGSFGTHFLIKQGAKLVERPEDILEEIPADRLINEEPTREIPISPKVPLTPEEAVVVEAVTMLPQHVDKLARDLSLEMPRLLSLLLALELKGQVRQLPGKQYVREGKIY